MSSVRARHSLPSSRPAWPAIADGREYRSRFAMDSVLRSLPLRGLLTSDSSMRHIKMLCILLRSHCTVRARHSLPICWPRRAFGAGQSRVRRRRPRTFRAMISLRCSSESFPPPQTCFVLFCWPALQAVCVGAHACGARILKCEFSAFESRREGKRGFVTDSVSTAAVFFQWLSWMIPSVLPVPFVAIAVLWIPQRTPRPLQIYSDRKNFSRRVEGQNPNRE
jgi:hypothetical protein